MATKHSTQDAGVDRLSTQEARLIRAYRQCSGDDLDYLLRIAEVTAKRSAPPPITLSLVPQLPSAMMSVKHLDLINNFSKMSDLDQEMMFELAIVRRKAAAKKNHLKIVGGGVK
ncbi:MAG: hypothetical protein V4448_02885 [Pseudomonadota bacterium]